jgi:hypothetical protein
MLIHRSLYKGIAKEWATLIIRLGANGKKFKLYRIRVSGTLKPLKINSYNAPQDPPTIEIKNCYSFTKKH